MPEYLLTTSFPESPDDARERCVAETLAKFDAGGVVVVRGMPGAGVTRLLRRFNVALQEAGARTGFVTFDAEERDFPYSALERVQLALPRLQGFQLSPGDDPHQVAVAFLNAFLEDDGDAARGGQMQRDCLVLDELQACDEASERVLRYALPRLVARGALVVGGSSLMASSSFVETVTVLAGETGRGRVVTIPDLTTRDIVTMVRERSGVGVSNTVAERVRRLTGGRFGAVTAYLAALDESVVADLSAIRVLPEHTNARMRQHRSVDLADLTPQTRVAAMTCSVRSGGVPSSEFRRVCKALGVATAGHVGADGQTVELNTVAGTLHLADPLAADDIVAASSPEDLRIIHRVLGDCTYGVEAHLHRLAAIDEFDESAVTDVLETARVYESRGRGGDALKLLDGVSKLARGTACERRLLIAFGLLCVRQLGGVDYQERMGDFVPHADDDVRAAYVYACMRTYKAHGRLEAEVLRRTFMEAPTDNGDHAFLQADIAFHEFLSEVQTGGVDVSAAFEEVTTRFEALGDASPEDPDLAWLSAPRRLALAKGIHSFVQVLAGTHPDPDGVPGHLLAVAAKLPADSVEGVDLLTLAASLYGARGLLESAAAALDEVTARERLVTIPSIFQGTLDILRVDIALRAGDWEGGRAALAVGMARVNDVMDLPTRVVLPAISAWFSIVSGDLENGERFLRMAETADRYRYYGYGRHWLRFAQAEYAMHTGGRRRALEALCDPRDVRESLVLSSFRIQLLASLGKMPAAREAMAAVPETRWESSASAREMRLFVEAALTLGDGDASEAVDKLQQVLAHAEHPLMVGRGEWMLAEALERQRGTSEAVEAAYLRAEQAHAKIGAFGYVTQIRAAAERARKRRHNRLASLTAREQQVASLAAEGWTNKEIGVELRIGAATVAYHVSNVLAKLELASRSEIRQALR